MSLTFKPKNIFVFPKYGQDYDPQYDIALLACDVKQIHDFTQKHTQFPQVSLINKENKENFNFNVFGYEYHEGDNERCIPLYQVSYNDKKSSDYFKFKTRYLSSSFCGGPLFVEYSPNNYYNIGMLATTNQSRSRFLGNRYNGAIIYEKDGEIINWIESTIKENDKCSQFSRSFKYLDQIEQEEKDRNEDEELTNSFLIKGREMIFYHETNEKKN